MPVITRRQRRCLILLAIADKMDTRRGSSGIGQHPKGDKDPFALRRAALGVLRIIVERLQPRHGNADTGSGPPVW